MGCGDDCTRSRDVDNLESKTRDLDFRIDRLEHDLQRQIDYLQNTINSLKEQVNYLENRGS